MRKVHLLHIFFLTLLVFRNWFFTKDIIGGDWPFFYRELLSEMTLFPPAWASYQSNGLGGQFINYPLDSYLYFVVAFFVNNLHLPWGVVSKVFFFGLFVIISYFSSIYLLKTVFPKSKKWNSLFHFTPALIYTANTYILMVVGGGQMGVALAYSIAPLVLARFIRLSSSIDLTHRNVEGRKWKVENLILAGLVLGIQIMFDVRIGYLSMVMVFLYILFTITTDSTARSDLVKLTRLIIMIGVSAGIALMLNASWIIPIVISAQTPLDSVIGNFSSVDSFSFFSFSVFSQSISLLHPNWPENIFGKVYFMRPEFLVLPVLAFSSLLFLVNSKHKTQSIFFAFLGLLGAFLAKGVNPPFGELNIFLFEYLPGFSVLRDPTKFYLFVALSYSVLIPFGVYSIHELVSSKFKVQSSRLQFKIKNYLPNLFLLSITCYLLLLIHPSWIGQLGGTFAKREIPKEYFILKDFLSNQPQFFRTLWISRQSRFTYYSNTHPSVETGSLFSVQNKKAIFSATSSAEIIGLLGQVGVKEYLQNLAVRYIIIPQDDLGEIFLKDRDYDEDQYRKVVNGLDSLDWLEKKSVFGKIVVYEVPNPKNHFFTSQGFPLAFKKESTTSYTVFYPEDKSLDFVFSENYSPHWKAISGDKTISSQKTDDGLNRFFLANPGNKVIKIVFDLEKYYMIGQIISGATLFWCVLVLLKLPKRSQHEKN